MYPMNAAGAITHISFLKLISYEACDESLSTQHDTLAVH